MDSKITSYRNLLTNIIDEYVSIPTLNPTPEKETIFVADEKRDHYFLYRIGWEGTKRVWNTTLYVRIKDGKFWLEIDWTEDGIATELLEAGVPNQDIVLAFHHPSVRQHTEFAVA